MSVVVCADAVAVNTRASRKRSADDADLTVGSKLPPSQSNALLEGFVCAITQKLPVDPVLAEDGQVYDRLPLLDWFARNPGPQCKSPLTNEEMNKKLVPATAIKNTLDALINSGIVCNDETEEWTRAVKEQECFSQDFKEDLTEATQGDSHAMNRVGNRYRSGNGAPQDRMKAFEWYKKAARLDNPRAICSLGVLYSNGVSCARHDTSRGILELARAATLGSEHACIVVATWLTENSVEISKDEEAATYWYRKSLDCKHKDSVQPSREERDQWLKNHPA